MVPRAVPVIVAIVAIAAGCGEDEPSGLGPARQDATATETRDPDGGAGRSAARLPRTPGPLKPGVYVTSQFDPGFTITLGRGWQLLSPESPTFLTFLHGDDPNSDPLLAFLRPTRVVDPRRRYLKSDVPQDALLPPPKDLAGWFARHPFLKASDAKSRTVGGVDATQVDTVIQSGYRYPGCPSPCLLVFAPNPDLLVTAQVGQKVRNIVVDVGRVPIVVGILAPEGRFTEHVAVGERALATLKFSAR